MLTYQGNKWCCPTYFGGCLLRWLRLQSSQKEGLGHRLDSKKGSRKSYLRPVKAQSQNLHYLKRWGHPAHMPGFNTLQYLTAFSQKSRTLPRLPYTLIGRYIALALKTLRSLSVLMISAFFLDSSFLREPHPYRYWNDSWLSAGLLSQLWLVVTIPEVLRQNSGLLALSSQSHLPFHTAPPPWLASPSSTQHPPFFLFSSSFLHPPPCQLDDHRIPTSSPILQTSASFSMILLITLTLQFF